MSLASNDGGLELEDAVPGAKTLWLYREALAKAGAVEELFDLFDRFLKDKGYLARRALVPSAFRPQGKKKSASEGGQIIDSTIVSAPKQHNSREENETIKEGETPEDRSFGVTQRTASFRRERR